MTRKTVNRRATLRVMRQISLSELLKRARPPRSLREMARQTGLSVTTIKRLEDGEIDLPTQETMPLLAAAYGLPLDDLARAAYGSLFEPSPDADAASPTDAASPADTSGEEWQKPGPRLRRPTPAIS